MMDEDRLSASSADSDHDNDNEQEQENENENENENEVDEVMEDADDAVDNDDDNNDEDEDEEADQEGEESATQNTNVESSVKPETDDNVSTRKKSATPGPSSGPPWCPTVRLEALKARLYDIVPTMAAPQSTSINAMAVTPDMRYWLTGGSDGYIRKYDGPNTINGKLALTVAQKHPFVDSVTKAGILMSYWENEEPTPPGRGEHEHILSPVYSLAVHSEALWLLSGLESGGINLQSVRHDEGKRIACLQKHANAVSVLTLAQDERSVLSGSWDKNIFDWDLNTGNIIRSFDGSGGQISAIELRPASGAPVPARADEPPPSTTMSTNNGLPPAPGNFVDGSVPDAAGGPDQSGVPAGDGTASPAHESLFGGSDAGSLFGDDAAGEQPFGQDDDEYGAGMHAMSGHEHEGGMDHSADMAMASLEGTKDAEADPAPVGQPSTDSMDVDSAPTRVDKKEVPVPPAEPSTQPGPSSQAEPSQSQTDTTQPLSPGVAERAALKASQSPPPPLAHETGPTHHDPSQTSTTTFLSAAIDGTLRVWDRRVQNPVARIGNRPGVPPWCMGTCWSPDGNMIYAGRRNGTVEEFDIRQARRGWEPRRVLKFPAGSGAVSAVRPMVNGRHLVCASYDILRLYDLQESRAFKHSTVPFLIIPGPPRAGVISSLYIDPTSRFMLSAAGTRGWEGTSTEVLIGYEINVSNG